MSLKIDKFKIKKHVGNGSFGDVYLCYDPFLKKEIALKVIKVPDPNNIVNAVKEGQILDICRHKHIVDVKDVRSSMFEGQPVVIIVMEYLAKGSVQKFIENNFVTPKEACKIIQQTLLGLEHAHNNNILHKDIKPSNLMMGDNTEVKLSDFGLAINYHSEPSDIDGYRSHQPLEVILGKPMDKLSDIYATGITYYRLLNNEIKINFRFKNRREWSEAVKKEIFPDRFFLPHIPDKLIKIFKKAIHNDRAKRFKNCVEFRQSLEKIKFFIEWIKVNDDAWIGTEGRDKYEILKVERRKGWDIDFKKNGMRKKEKCSTALRGDEVETIFYSLIKETTIC